MIIVLQKEGNFSARGNYLQEQFLFNRCFTDMDSIFNLIVWKYYFFGPSVSAHTRSVSFAFTSGTEGGATPTIISYGFANRIPEKA